MRRRTPGTATTGLLLAGILATGALATTTTAADAASPERAQTEPKIAIEAKRTEVSLGKKVVITGTVKSKRITRVALQQKRPGKKWKVQSTAKVNRKGKFTVKDKPTTANLRKYRVISRTGPKQKSAKIEVGVYEWRDLTKMKTRTAEGLGTVKRIGINAVEYGPALAGYRYYSTGMVDFNLARECTALRARFGLGDDSDAGVSAQISVTVDGAVAFSKSFVLTQSESQTLRFEPAFRLGIDYKTTNPAADPTQQYGAQVAVVQPEVYCTRR